MITRLKFPLPVLGFAAYSGTGKTTLLTRLIPLLKHKGIRTGLIKHTHHDIEMDQPGKDSYRLRKAGASQIVVAGKNRITSIVESPQPMPEASLSQALSLILADSLDLIMVEGFKSAPIPKIELHRAVLQKPYLYPDDPAIIALVTDQPEKSDQKHRQHPLTKAKIPLLDINHPAGVATFIEHWLITQQRRPNNLNPSR